MSDVRLMSSPSISSLEPTKSQPPYFVPLTTEPLTKETLVVEPPTVETQTIESPTVEPPSHEAFRSYVDTTIAQWGSLILDRLSQLEARVSHIESYLSDINSQMEVNKLKL